MDLFGLWHSLLSRDLLVLYWLAFLPWPWTFPITMSLLDDPYLWLSLATASESSLPTGKAKTWFHGVLTCVVQRANLVGVSADNFKRQFGALVHVAEGFVLASSLELLKSGITPVQVPCLGMSPFCDMRISSSGMIPVFFHLPLFLQNTRFYVFAQSWINFNFNIIANLWLKSPLFRLLQAAVFSAIQAKKKVAFKELLLEKK